MKDKMFKAMVVSETEDKQDKTVIRQIKEKSINELPPGEVLVRVMWSALNYKDALSATGHRGVTQNYPHTPGIDAAGIVEESSLDSLVKGDRVLVTGYDLGMNTPGGFAQYIRVPAAWVVKLPPPLSLKDAMVYGTAGFTAAIGIQKLLERGISVEQGDILVTGATGGVGCLAVALLANLGFKVTAATGKKEAQQWLRDLGASAIISRDEIKDTPARPLLKGRWAGVIDTVGGEYLAAAIKSSKHNGTVACCGLVAAADFNINVFPFILRGVDLLGIESAEFPMEPRLTIWHNLANQWCLPKQIMQRICKETDLHHLDGFIDDILLGKIMGRIIIDSLTER